jgi:ppGpp synthetase/RelA/SpoT-type nucleotidyltranferase
MRPRGRTDREIFERLHAAGAVAVRLRALTESLGPDFASTQFYTRIRVKSYDSIIKKIYSKRRKKGKELYSLEDVTDIVGFRIVTLYDDDLMGAVKHVLRLVRSNGQGLSKAGASPDQLLFKPLRKGKPTEWDFIREAIFFTRRDGHRRTDAYRICHESFVKMLEDSFDKNSEIFKLHRGKIKLPEAKEEEEMPQSEGHSPEPDSYSSIHLILNAFSMLGPEPIDIPIEVQIRTAADDIWGEIDHQLFYKAKNLYVWTPSLHDVYQEMHDDSELIKGALNSLRDPISRFSRHSVRANEIITTFREPTTTYHRSLIVTLFYAMGNEFFDLADPILKQYDNMLKKLARTKSEETAAKLLFQCIGLVRDISHAFDESRKGIRSSSRNRKPASARQAASADALFAQRKLLCELEIERLRALAVVRFNHVLADKPHRILPEKRVEETKKVFGAICELRNSDALEVRPVVMMSYWKYILAKNIDLDVALYHLRLAFDELEQDASLPKWSIYRILVPRALAAESYEQVVKLVHENGRRTEREIWWRSQFAADTQVVLDRAFWLAIDAYNKDKRRDRRAGDMVFGYEKNEYIRAADVITNIASLYFNLFDDPDYEGLGISKDFLRERAIEVRFFFANLESADWVESRLVRIERLLVRLASA